MKKLLFILMMPLMLGALAACSDDSEGIISLDTQEDTIPVGTRIGEYLVSYYWFNGAKIPIYLHDNSCMIIYHAEDEEAIVARLEEMGLTKDDMKSKADYIISPKDFENPQKVVYDYQDTKRATISNNYEQALNISEVVYATPCASSDIFPEKIFPISNLIYVDGNNYAKIEKIAKELNVDILGKISGIVGNYYEIACNRNSKGNPLEVINACHNVGLIAEPIFLNLSGGSIVD